MLTGSDGRVLARYEPGTREGVPWADLFEPEPGAHQGEVVAEVMRQLSGWTVAADAELGEALVAAGAAPRRRGCVLGIDLRDQAHVCAGTFMHGVAIEPVGDRGPEALLESAMAAYPPGHLDFLEGEDDAAVVHRRFDELMSGLVVGPLLACSRVAVDTEGRVVGAALLNELPAAAPFGGPWLAELFRTPGNPGVGRALLLSALAAAAEDGLERVGLAVTEGNSARALYDEVGFELVQRFFSVRVP